VGSLIEVPIIEVKDIFSMPSLFAHTIPAAPGWYAVDICHYLPEGQFPKADTELDVYLEIVLSWYIEVDRTAPYQRWRMPYQRVVPVCQTKLSSLIRVQSCA
jgi:hypothetical protein